MNLWVTDIVNHVVLVYSIADLEPVAFLGVNGTAGKGLAPRQFGSVADVANDDNGNVSQAKLEP